MSSVAHRRAEAWTHGAIRREVFIQRAAFSCPDLDQSEPQYAWMVPVFEHIVRPAGDLSISGEFLSEQRSTGSYDLGL